MFKVDGKKLELVRNSKGKGQELVAKELGISQGAYSTREKIGNFNEDQIKKICKFLGIKKEQIQLQEVSGMPFLVSKAIQTESTLKVILGTLGDIYAHLSQTSPTVVREDLQALVDSLSRQAQEQLGQPVSDQDKM